MKFNVIDLNDLGCSLHTALRKACESTATSLAYNLIAMADVEWTVWLRALWRRLEEKHEPRHLTRITQSELIDCIMKQCKDWYPTGTGYPRKRHGEFENEEMRKMEENLLLSIGLAIRLFDDSDLHGFTCYCFEEDR